MALFNGIRQWFYKKIGNFTGSHAAALSKKRPIPAKAIEILDTKSKAGSKGVRKSHVKDLSGTKKSSSNKAGSPIKADLQPEPELSFKETTAQIARWEGLLKTLRITPSKLKDHLTNELKKGLSTDEQKIAPKREGQFFDGLILGRKVHELDQLSMMLEGSAISSRLHTKIPTLAKWAKGDVGEAGLLASVCPEIVAWAKQGKHFKEGELRESHLAEAIETGQEKVMQAVLADGGLEKLQGEQARRFLEAFATRKESGLSEGLDAAGLDALAQAMGGWESALENVGHMSLQEALQLIESMLKAIKEESLVDDKILKETNSKASKQTRELIAKALALQAARDNRPQVLNSVLLNSQTLLGMSAAAAANLRSEYARVKVGSLVSPLQLKDDSVSLYEVAWLSQAPAAQEELKRAGAREINKERQKVLVKEVETQIKRMAMRSESGSTISKVWRETLKEWKGGLMGDAKMSDLQKVVDKKLEVIRKQDIEKVDPEDPKHGKLKM